MTVDTSYSGATANKTLRSPTDRYVARCWHETGNGSGNPYQTLEYNLSSKVESSYHYLIARDGTVFEYLAPDAYTAWHAGDSAMTIDGVSYTDWSLNVATVGIELDGANSGTPCTAAQIDAAALLAIALRDELGIDLSGPYDVTHKQVAQPPGRKSDPRGATVAQILNRAHEFDLQPVMDEPCIAWWLVIAMDGANVREAPTRAAPIALGGTAVVPYGRTCQSDVITYGESIGGDSAWLHGMNPVGFIHRSCLQRTG